MSKKQRQRKAAFSGFETAPRRQIEIKCINRKQKEYLNQIERNDITFGIGAAGTGKTFLAALMAMKYFTDGLVDRIVICRPAVMAGGEDIGFLPGGINDKMDPFIQPIFDAFRTFWTPTTIREYIRDGKIEIVPLAFMRGRTFRHTFILADEAQNATPDNLLMLLTRLGEGSKMVITGDPRQSDINGRTCLKEASHHLDRIDGISFVYFSNADVVRHPTVEKILNRWPENGFVVRNQGPEYTKEPEVLIQDAG